MKKEKKIDEEAKEKEKCCCEEECCCGDECNCDDTCECKKNKEEEVLSFNEEEVLLLKNTIENLNKKVQQTQAELINYRKRKDEETKQIMKYANKDIISELLVIIDNFERALNVKNENPDFDKYSDGYKLIYNGLTDVLKKFGVSEIDAFGKEFDPNLHEAVMLGQDETKDNDIILEVFTKGYMLKDRVLRASKVKVNKID